MPSALDVAQFFLASNPPSSITKLKLQMLCAYAQAISLAYLDAPLFDEELEAWDLGPVVASIDAAYQSYANLPIPQAEPNLAAFSMQQRLVLAGVNDEYASNFDSWELCVKAHEDFPSVSLNQIFAPEALKERFRSAPLVQRFRSVDEYVDDDDETLSAEEFFRSLGIQN